MIKFFGISISILLLNSFIYGQAGHFKVELEPFDPDANQMIEMMEGSDAEHFELLDINGQLYKSIDFNDQRRLYWYFDKKDELSSSLIDGMNLMHRIFGDSLEFVAFTYGKSDEVAPFLTSIPINYTVIPNCVKLGELHYSSELGMARIFLVDHANIIRKAIPRQFFINHDNSFNTLRDIIHKFLIFEYSN